MYVHPAFKIETAQAIELLRQRGFGLFVVAAPDAPFGVHVPFLLEERADGALYAEFHVARVNPVHEHIGQGCAALLACQGPDAYISPDWYNVPDQVPTWTYTAMHLKGRGRLVSRSETLSHVDRLSAANERLLAPKPPWTSDKMNVRKRDAMINAIVVIGLEVDTIEAQVKVGQHKGETERRGAIEGLESRGDPGSLAIANLIRQTLDADSERN